MNLKTATSIRQKIALVLFGLILSLVILEAGMRFGGFVLLSIQEYGNLRSTKQKGSYRILCLGESTTFRQYPHLLEQVLNQRHIGVRFSVTDRGMAGAITPVILSRVESYLAKDHPDMVVAMMGINDTGIGYYKDIPESDSWLFRHCRIYRFIRILCVNLLKVLQKKDTGGFPRAASGRKTKPEDAETQKDKAYVELGRFFLEQVKFSQAENLFKKALEINPKNDQAYVEFGKIYRSRGDDVQAEGFFKKAIEFNPKNDHAYVGLGQLYLEQGKFLQVEDSLKKAVELNPENDKAWRGLGRIYRKNGKFPEAEDAFRQYIKSNPVNDSAYVEFGTFYREQGKFPQAEDLFKKAIELNPENDRAAGAMFSMYEEMGKPELAKEYAVRADGLRSEYYAAVTVDSYRKLKKILDKKGIKLLCVQYPVRNVDPLKKIFRNDKGVTFVSNEMVFKKALKQGGYKEYFKDMFAGDFGHCTRKGNMLLAENIADVILTEVFNKS